MPFNLFGTIPRSLLRNGHFECSQGPSFPHAFSGNPGETRTGPPIKTFGGDAFGENYHKVLSIPRSLLRGSSFTPCSFTPCSRSFAPRSVAYSCGLGLLVIAHMRTSEKRRL